MAWKNDQWVMLKGQDGQQLRSAFQSLTTWLAGPSQQSCVPLMLYPHGWAIPVAAAEESNAYRAFVDLTDFVQFKWNVHPYGAGFAGAYVRLQYTTDTTGATGWTDMDTSTDLAVNAVGAIESAWTDIPSLARTQVLLRYQGYGGNGVAANYLCNMHVWLKP